MIYSTGHAEEITHIAEMGGVQYQYLSHRHEAGPSLEIIKRQFASTLCCDEKERVAVSKSCEVDLTSSENTRPVAERRNMTAQAAPDHVSLIVPLPLPLYSAQPSLMASA